MGPALLLQVAPTAPALDPLAMEIVKLILAAAATFCVTYFFHRSTERQTEARAANAEHEVHQKVHDDLKDDLAQIRLTVELHDSFIDPLRRIFQENMVTALLKTNPFTPIENEAALRIMALGFPYAETNDLYIVRSGARRIIEEVEEKSAADPHAMPKGEKEMDQMVYAGVLAGIEHELARRRVELQQTEIDERRRERWRDPETKPESDDG